MIERVLVPQAFENMEEATLGAWRKREGDPVSPGDPLCELITEKTTFDLPAEATGTLLHVAATEKSVLPVGSVLALVGPAEAAPEEIETAARAAIRDNEALRDKRSAPAPDQPQPLSVPALSVPAASTSGAASISGARVRSTPAAKRAAKELGVDLEAVAAKVGGKVVSEEDVRAFAAA